MDCFVNGAKEFGIGLFESKSNVKVAFLAGLVGAQGSVAGRQEDLGAADLLQRVPRLQGVQPGRQRRRQVHGLPDGPVERPGGRRLRDLPV